MGLMDRDYYREKPKEGFTDKLRRNPLIVVILILLLILFVAYVI